MKPRDIANKIGPVKIEGMVDELNSGQFKRILIAGDIPTRIPSSVLSLKARSRLWQDRLLDGLNGGNDAVASALIYEWLLGRRRPSHVQRERQRPNQILPRPTVHTTAIHQRRRHSRILPP